MINVLFYNPNSGNKSFKDHIDLVVEKFHHAGKELIPHRLGDKALLRAFVKTINWDQVDKIIIAGGDGTIHNMINFLMKKGIEKPIALFPVGTANDFSQMFGIPSNLNEMVKVALDDYCISCDLGMANDRFFVNVASFGSLVEVGHRVNPQLKNTLGVLAYYIKGIEELPKLKPVQIVLESSNRNFEGEIFFALIMNGKSAGGFRKLAPMSDVQDGMFDVLIFKKCPLLEIMPLLIKVWNGEHPNSPYIEYFQAEKLTITTDDKISSDLDGELGPELPLKITNHQQKLMINVKRSSL